MTTTVLAAHIDRPDQRHRCVLLDERRLRCHDCARTIVLPSTAGSTSTSRSPIPGPGEPRCPRHQHEHADACRPCAADAKADPGADDQHGHRQVEHQPTADVSTRVAEARAALAAWPRRRTPIRYMKIDPDRLAAAHAELDALRQSAKQTTEPTGDPT